MNKQSETVEQVALRALQSVTFELPNKLPPGWIKFATALLSDPAVLELVPGVKELREENERLTADVDEARNRCIANGVINRQKIASLEQQLAEGGKAASDQQAKDAGQIAAMAAALKICESAFLSYDINRIDGDVIAENILAVIRASLYTTKQEEV